MTDLLQQLQKEITELQKTRDELKLKLHLAKADAKDEWHKLEDRLADAQSQIKGLRAQAKEPAQEVANTAKQLVNELKEGYARVRKHF